MIDVKDDGTERTITRREYNERFGQSAPEVEIPEPGVYLWDWYHDCAARIRRIVDGVCTPIPPSEWLAWREITGDLVYRWEFGILHRMDLAYCEGLNRELADRRARKEAEAKKK